MDRREVHYRGHVQGVGFRYTARRIAAGYDVSGYVANLPDGSVQLVAEGDTLELDRFLAELGRVMQDHIQQTREDRQEATGEFTGFEIRHG